MRTDSPAGVAPSQTCFARADCNNFYASCEAVFRPDLQGRAVIVLGNNDGNIIARSNPAKQLGIQMGAPLHQVQHLVNAHGVAVCSANFALYGDMSQRVMSVLGGFTPALDVYSIDEAFLDLAHVPSAARGEHAAEIRRTILQWTGIPVSIGVAPTKTLAKVAAEVAKQTPAGVLALGEAAERDALLRTVPVGDVWGIGPARAAFLKRHAIETAYNLAQADSAWVRRHLTVMGQRTQLELRGVSCLPLETSYAAKKQVCCSRSFGRDITSLADLKEVVAQYASWAAERVRAQRTCATVLTVFLATNAFRTGVRQYHQSCTISLPRATNDTLEVVRAALGGLARSYREGYAYHKAGVILTGMVPESPAQLTLLDEPDYPQRRELMEIMDTINGRFGHDTIRVAATGTAQPWRMKQRARSPRYTTRWDELARGR